MADRQMFLQSGWIFTWQTLDHLNLYVWFFCFCRKSQYLFLLRLYQFFVCLQETLVEVLGIKERSLTHLEQLTEQLEQKEHTIACLKSKLLQFNENTPDMLYRVKQQVDWFSENVSQQCAKGNIPEEVNNQLPFIISTVQLNEK